ncbi:MAG: hypothetical protein M1275_03965 [Patescibacteria group bacterium]|nr:hypothetical protein [Patescibacteria group bacterium]
METKNLGSHEQSGERGTEEQEAKFRELKALWEAAMDADSIETYSMCAIKSQALEAQYGRKACEDCRLWHLISGSSMNTVPETFDLGDGEIERFLRTEIGS